MVKHFTGSYSVAVSLYLRNLVKHVISLQMQFKTDIYGTFRQSVVFDFGSEPKLVRQLCVDSGPISDIDKLQQDLILTETGRWDISSKTVIQFEPRFVLFDYLEKCPPPQTSPSVCGNY